MLVWAPEIKGIEPTSSHCLWSVVVQSRANALLADSGFFLLLDQRRYSMRAGSRFFGFGHSNSDCLAQGTGLFT